MTLVRKLLPILGITFVDILGFSMLIPVMPYFVTHFGAAPVVVGLIFATFSFCQLVTGPLWGNVSDRIGRKRVLIVSQIGATIGWALLAVSPSIGWIFFARIIEGVSGGNISITQAYVADVVEQKQRARAFSYIGATFGCGMVFGPLGGGLLYARFGFSAPFFAASALQFVTLVLTIFMLPESRAHTGEESQVGLRDLLITLHNRTLRPLLLQRLGLALSLYGWYGVIALYLKDQLGFSLVTTNYCFSAFAFLNVVTNVAFVGRASERRGDRGMSNLGLAALLCAFALLPFAHAVWLFALAMVLFSYGGALAQSGLTALISNAASARDQGTVLGVNSLLDSVAGIGAPPISTGLLGRFGSPYAGDASFLFGAISLVLGLSAAVRHRRSPAPNDA